jgi:hypothetical protein
VRKSIKILTGTVITFIVGLGLVLGNAALVSYAINQTMDAAPVITPDSSSQPEEDSLWTVVVMSDEGLAVLAAKGPSNGIEVYDTGILNTVTTMGPEELQRVLAERLTRKDNKEDSEEERERLMTERVKQIEVIERRLDIKEPDSEELRDRIVERLKALGYSDEEIREALKNPVYMEGNPNEDDITVAEAIEIAVSALQKEYALTERTISRFVTHTGFNVADPEHPAWHINFNPASRADFSEIGCYKVVLDSKTGEVLEIMSMPYRLARQSEEQ